MKKTTLGLRQSNSPCLRGFWAIHALIPGQVASRLKPWSSNQRIGGERQDLIGEQERAEVECLADVLVFEFGELAAALVGVADLLGVAEPDTGVTVAVNVTGWPATAGFSVEMTVVTVVFVACAAPTA